MPEKVMDLIKNGNFTFPKILLFNYQELKINESQLILLIYLMNLKDTEFNPNNITKDLKMPLTDVLTNIDVLTNLNLIKIDLRKIDGVRHEFINIDQLYEKLLYLVINEEKEEIPSNIFSTFETEFGRTLAPMEYEIINSWIDSGYSEELIIAALKEAVYNGVFKLNYIDKILYEWGKKGIKSIQDIEKEKTKFQSKKEEKKELYDYNWLEDE
jgi:primosome